MSTARLPRTDSIDKLARFWDTHDLTDFEDQLEEISEPVFQRGRNAVEVPLAPDEIEAVEDVAKSEGSDLAALLRTWIVEKLNEIRTTRQPGTRQPSEAK